MITNYKVKIMILLSMLLLSLLFVGNGLASANESISSEDDECSTCHYIDISINPAIATQAKCKNCHGNGHASFYMIDEREDYHRIHNGINNNDTECVTCHYTPNCSACHNIHMPGTESCLSCHGSLSSPRSHVDVRSDFSNGNHSWMGHCNTCHSGDKLNISNSCIADLSESNTLCETCHSTQMNDMSRGEHGERGNKCVACHNPHTTYSMGSAIFLSKTGGFNWNRLKTSIIDGIKKLFSSKTGIIIAIICALGITLVSKRFMTKYEKDMVILTDNSRRVHSKENSEVLHIKIFGLSVIEQIIDSIERMDIEVFSATIKKSNHALVLFLDFSMSTTSKEELLENVNKFKNVISAEYYDSDEI